MKTVTLVALVSLLVTSSASLAETEAQRAACTSDVLRLCSSEIPDVGAIKTCLRREKRLVSPACRVAMGTGDRPAVRVARR